MSKKRKNSNSAITPMDGLATSDAAKNGTKSIRDLGATLTPHKYNATFVREGTLGRKRNALLVILKDEADHLLCDHLWVNTCKAFERLTAGDVISFIATPYRYIKGYSGKSHVMSEFSTNVSLRDITQVRVVGHNPVIEKNVNDYNEKADQ